MKDILKKISIILGVVGIATVSFESIVHFSDVLNKQFWPLIIIAYVLTVGAIWPEKKLQTIGFKSPYKNQPTLRQYRWILLITLFFLLLIAFRLYQIYIPTEGNYPTVNPIPAFSEDQKQIEPSNLNQWNGKPNGEGQITEANEFVDSTNLPILQRFSLNESKTSFVESNQSFAGILSNSSYKTYSMDPGFYNKSYPEQCICNWNTSEYVNVSEALKHYTALTGKQQYDKYINDDAWVEYLLTKHPDVTQHVIPNGEEWSKLSTNDYATILRWIRCCVGIPYPTFVCVIQNPSNEELIVDKIHFNVLKIGQVMSAEEGIIAPKASYVFNLKHATGTQVLKLMPAGFRIAANSTYSFELQVFTDTPDMGLCWLMNVEFITTHGNVKTDNFQLIMSGKPTWYRGLIK
ncbi:MAG: hypothetical protein JWO44_598 [Bacteroidetes bacterium]|nr:hypothetical protein [Bacteroidota bacterium]